MATGQTTVSVVVAHAGAAEEPGARTRSSSPMAEEARQYSRSPLKGTGGYPFRKLSSTPARSIPPVKKLFWRTGEYGVQVDVTVLFCAWCGFALPRLVRPCADWCGPAQTGVQWVSLRIALFRNPQNH